MVTNKRKSCITNGCQKRKNLNDDGKCPLCVERINKFLAKKTDDKPLYPCGICSLECPDGIRALMCHYCESWTHAKCVNIDDEDYDKNLQIKNLRWFCDACDSKLEQLLEKSVMLEAQTKALQVSMQKVETRLDSVESKISGTVHKEIHAAINERTDIENRKMNLVIYNLPEAVDCNDENSSWDNTTRVDKDTAQFKEIVEKHLKINMGTAKIKNARRLGKRTITVDENVTKPRPRVLKITFEDIKTKRDILSMSKELRNAEDGIAKGIYINPDLTTAQRDKDRQLRKEMWNLRINENKNVIIQKGQIVEVNRNVRKTKAIVSKPVTAQETPKDSDTGNSSKELTESGLA